MTSAKSTLVLGICEGAFEGGHANEIRIRMVVRFGIGGDGDDGTTDDGEDDDGVFDEDDFCFGTTAGSNVDIDGCSDEDLADDGDIEVEVTGCGAIGMIPFLFMVIGIMPLRRRT